VASGKGLSKWIRGEYGTGKTFAARYLCARARERNFATSEVQISINDTPLHHLETVYRRLIERRRDRLRRPQRVPGDRRGLALQDRRRGHAPARHHRGGPRLRRRDEQRLEDKLAEMSRSATPPSPRCSAPTTARPTRVTSPPPRACSPGSPGSPTPTARSSARRHQGQGRRPGVADLPRRSAPAPAPVRLRRPGRRARRGRDHPADERADPREVAQRPAPAHGHARQGGAARALSGHHRHPRLLRGLQGPQGRSRRSTSACTSTSATTRRSTTSARPRCACCRSREDRLLTVGRRVRDLYPAKNAARVAERVDDASSVPSSPRSPTGFGGKVSLAPRLFLRELIDVLDRVDLHERYDPVTHYKLELDDGKLTPEELAAKHGRPSKLPRSRGGARSPREPTPPAKPRRLDG
jgi:hypothetical protein